MQLKFLKFESKKMEKDVIILRRVSKEPSLVPLDLKNQWDKIYLLLSLIVFDVQQLSIEHIPISRNNHYNWNHCSCQ